MIKICVLCLLGFNTYFDLKNREISKGSLCFFILLGFFINGALRYQTFIQFFGGILIGGVLLVIGWMTKESVGYGDGLLLCTTGIFLGFWKNIELLLWGLIFCAVFSSILMILRKMKRRETLPFVPFLFFAYMACCIFELGGTKL